MRKWVVSIPALVLVSIEAFPSAISYSDEFTSSELQIVRSAVKLAWQRILDPDVERCTRNVANWELLSRGFLNKIYGGSFNSRGLFLYSQLAFLRRASRGGVFPNLKINAYSSDDFSAGRADLDLIKVFKDKYSGSFRIALNRNKFYGRGISISGWAGVIAHELLHNLSHKHPDPGEVGLKVAYDDDYQINAYHNCVHSDGRYVGNNIAIVYRCGGRETQD